MVKQSPYVGKVRHSFDEQDDFILNYRPIIDFVEPEQISEEAFLAAEVPPTLDSARNQTQKVIEGLKNVVALSDAVQKRVDQRVAAGGGLQIKLDPAKDYITIAAMKRRFPDRADPTIITYDDYKSALDCLQKQADFNALRNSLNGKGLEVTPEAIKAARQDPLRVDFGGYGKKQGENRPEISSPASTVEPLDLEAFQKAGIIALFALMLPLIIAQNQISIAEHILTIPHSPI